MRPEIFSGQGEDWSSFQRNDPERISARLFCWRQWVPNTIHVRPYEQSVDDQCRGGRSRYTKIGWVVQESIGVVLLPMCERLSARRVRSSCRYCCRSSKAMCPMPGKRRKPHNDRAPQPHRVRSRPSTPHRVSLYRVNVARRKRPRKEVEAALIEAEAAGWTVVRTSSAHRWGVMRCPEASRSGCPCSIWSTPRNSGNHARHLLRMLRNCRHRSAPLEDE